MSFGITNVHPALRRIAIWKATAGIFSSRCGKPKNQGDVQDFYIERKLKNTFVEDQVSWQIEMQHRTRSAKLQVIFPKKRHCIEATVIERTRERTTHLELNHFVVLPDGRQLLAWENIEPLRFETYIIQWKW